MFEEDSLKNQEKDSEDENIDNATNNKLNEVYKRIDNEKNKTRYKMVIINLVTITFLSMYFIGSFLMS